MHKLVNLTLTDADCFNMRMALNITAIEWGEKANAARVAGELERAATCERIRTEYHLLWEKVNAAQEAAPALDRRRDPMRPVYDRQSVARYRS
jgi:hypothetical protein